MLEGYIDFVKSLFPCISPYSQSSAKESIRQFYAFHTEFQCFSNNDISGLNQGDIISNIPFKMYDTFGDERQYNADGIIISNSCDIENDDQILIAPFFPIDEIGLDLSNLKNNLYFRLLFFPDQRYFSSVADLSLISPYPKKLILEKISEGFINRKFSLNQVGYYLLISKITVHLLRPEDLSVQSCREILTK